MELDTRPAEAVQYAHTPSMLQASDPAHSDRDAVDAVHASQNDTETSSEQADASVAEAKRQLALTISRCEQLARQLAEQREGARVAEARAAALAQDNEKLAGTTRGLTSKVSSLNGERAVLVMGLASMAAKARRSTSPTSTSPQPDPSAVASRVAGLQKRLTEVSVEAANRAKCMMALQEQNAALQALVSQQAGDLAAQVGDARRNTRVLLCIRFKHMHPEVVRTTRF